MNINKFNKKLNKISALSSQFNVDGQISTLEKDLLMSYIRDLYESISEFSVESIKKETSVSNHYQEMKSVIQAKELVKPVEIVAESMKFEKEEFVLAEKEPVLVSESGPSFEPRIVAKASINGNGKSQPFTSKFDNDILSELFAEDKITELSDKLALTPIKDLTKSMGINERIFTQQELFGNNAEIFSQTLDSLNKCQSFAEAKEYLIENVIGANDWTADHKIKKAATFIKLVKRKFA